MIHLDKTTELHNKIHITQTSSYMIQYMSRSILSNNRLLQSIHNFYIIFANSINTASSIALNVKDALCGTNNVNYLFAFEASLVFIVFLIFS